jgi:hypothetical protein
MTAGRNELLPKRFLDSGKTVLVPGAYDALSAGIAARGGADAGLPSGTEMAERAQALVAAAAPVPPISGADNSLLGRDELVPNARG